MGTHPNVPSKLTSSPSTTLSEAISTNPSLIGSKVAKAFPDTKDGSLPFLFKVLSIGTALSIQAHPDKPLAERLFKEKPDIYKGVSSTKITLIDR
jgi:mannose-6-phosphate isomerase